MNDKLRTLSRSAFFDKGNYVKAKIGSNSWTLRARRGALVGICGDLGATVTKCAATNLHRLGLVTQRIFLLKMLKLCETHIV